MQPAIVVTGASSGIGRALARAAARDGGILLLIGRDQQALDALAAELNSSAQAHAFAVDLAERDAGLKIENKLSEIGAYCDVLINSAGIGVFGAAAETSRNEHLKLVDVNIRALTEMTLRFLPGMVTRRRGGVLNVASITGYAPGPNMSTYFASKAYVRSFTAALATEMAGSGVTVTCFCPGVVRTAFFERCAAGGTYMVKLAPRANAPETAAVGWRGFRAGKRLVIPRLINRVIVSGAIMLPRAVVIRIVAGLLKLRRPDALRA
jgi:short-subunit dehydrogenase